MLRFVPALAGREGFGSADSRSLAGTGAGAAGGLARAEALPNPSAAVDGTRADVSTLGASSTGCGC